MSEIKEQNITQIGKFSVYSSRIPDYSGRNPLEFLEFRGIPGFRPESAESGRNQWRNGKYCIQKRPEEKVYFSFQWLGSIADSLVTDSGDLAIDWLPLLYPVAWQRKE